MKAFLCYLQPFESFTRDGMWLAEEPPPDHEEIDNIEVELTQELFDQIAKNELEPAAVEEIFRRLWEETPRPTRKTRRRRL